MRIGVVIGTVTLNRAHPDLQGGRFRLVRPLSYAELVEGREPSADPIAVYDELGAGIGSRVAISEGPEAAMPFRPKIKPLDAYCSAILDHIDLRALEDV